jgi:LytS/YehU family sensor histidine kinase
MMLLNLVENAMKHGAISQSHPLVVHVSMQEGKLEAIVRNHGQLAGGLPQRPGGLGVANARLQAVYGDTASLALHQEGTDVVAVLKIPASESPGESGRN